MAPRTLQPGTAVQAKPPGQRKPRSGVLESDLTYCPSLHGPGYKVKLDGGEVVEVPRRAVKVAPPRRVAPADAGKPTRKFPESFLPSLAPVVVTTASTLRPQPARPAKPTKAPDFLDFIRAKPCCHRLCQAPAPSDPHHDIPEADKAVGRKGSDKLCIPLCRTCHQAIQDTYCLPQLTREETDRFVAEEQVRVLAEWTDRQDAEIVRLRREVARLEGEVEELERRLVA